MTRMTCGLSSLLHRWAIGGHSGRSDRYFSLSGRMLKRPAQSPPEREAKALSQQGLPTSPIESAPANRSSSPNLNSDFSPAVETMLETTGDDDGRRVEYLDTPLKSETDKKEYRVIRLQNGLTALLIADIHSKTCASQDESDQEEDSNDETEDDESDEEDEDEDEDDEDDDDDDSKESDEYDEEDSISATKRIKREEKMAACALCVGVGSFSDPPEIPGMAHFLEHMVFMGSEKYPQENDFDAFITKRGGSDNASTECEQTTFHFDIQDKHFLSALDRFAQFFIKPLMKKDAITREREAVESEFQMALPSDSYRKEQLFCSFARTAHPARKFAWGNLMTLRDNINEDKLYEELHKFRERHYSAHRMKLAIQARLPLDTLEHYVTKCFSDVPNNGLAPDDFNEFKGAESFDTASFRRIYKIKPIKDFCQVCNPTTIYR